MCDCTRENETRGIIGMGLIWISPKDQLPESQDIVLVKLIFCQPSLLLTRYLDNLSSIDGDYSKIFIMMQPPKFPKEWYFDSRYSKMARIPKNKVRKWALIAKGDFVKEFFEEIDKNDNHQIETCQNAQKRPVSNYNFITMENSSQND